MSNAHLRIVDALQANGKQVLERGDRAKAQCPAHDDHTPSLEIAPRKDGMGVVIKCFAGCDHKAVLDAIGLSEGDLWDDVKMRDVYRPRAEYKYAGGRVKTRYPGPGGKKTFTQKNPHDKSLFMVERLQPADELVYLCEGEKAAEAIWAKGGVAVATGGAGFTCDMGPLRGKNVIIIADRDEAGRRWAARQNALLADIAQSVEVRQAAVDIMNGDACEHLAAGFELDELEPVEPSQHHGDGHETDGAEQLDDLLTTIKKYVVFPDDHAAVATALWIATTHALPAFQCAPRLVASSPQKRCGKTRLLDIIAGTCHEPLATANATVAAVFRSIGTTHPPTLILDEADALFGSKRNAENNEDLRALLNAGHQRGRPALRCVGPMQIPTQFPTFTMAAVAGIGRMPDTITDRAVNMTMRRRTNGEKVSQYRTRRDEPILHGLRDRLSAWAAEHLQELADAEPDMPVEDRAADTWEPLIAIADAAGGDWPTMARAACKALESAAGEDDEDASLATRLLSDTRQIFTDRCKPFLPSAELVTELRRIAESPWNDFELTQRKLATRLKPFGVISRRDTTGDIRGYALEDLVDAFRRYLRQNASDPSETIAEQQEQSDTSKTSDTSKCQTEIIRQTESAAQTPFLTHLTDSDDPPAAHVQGCRYCGAELRLPGQQQRGYCGKATCITRGAEDRPANTEGG